MLHIRLHIKTVLFVIVRQQLISLVPGNIEFIAEKRAYSTKLQDTLIPVHHGKFIPAHQFFATLSSGKFKKASAIIEINLLLSLHLLLMISDLSFNAIYCFI